MQTQMLTNTCTLKDSYQEPCLDAGEKSRFASTMCEITPSNGSVTWEPSLQPLGLLLMLLARMHCSFASSYVSFS